MPREFRVITNAESHTHRIVTPEERLRHQRNIVGSVLQDAQDTWGDIWDEFQGSVTHGVMVLPEAEEGRFVPRCGWPEFLEKVWLLKHYLDCAKRFCDPKA